MIFNGSEKPYIRVNIELFRPPTPPIEFLTQEKPKGGSRVRKKRFTDLILPVPVTILGNPTVEDIKEDMTNWLMHDEPKKLEFQGTPNRYYLAEYESIELDERKYRAKGYINFYLAEGYRFGRSRSINITPTTTTHTVTGQVETPWTIEVTFTGSANRFEAWIGESYLQLNFDFKERDHLVIDYTGRKVTLNGIDMRRIVSMSSHFEELAPGSLGVRASHECVLKYDERYY